MIALTKAPTLSLVKDRPISLAKTAGRHLTRIAVGLAWDPAPGLRSWFGGGAIDLDASCVCLDASGAVHDLVWFNKLSSREGAIRHSGDNRTGDGSGDDETIQVDLERLDARVMALVFTITSWTGQNFTRIGGSSCRLYDGDHRLARYDLAGQGSHTGLVMASLRRTGLDWQVTALGQPAQAKSVHDLAQQGVFARIP